jgi:hypothetical protein
MHTSTERVTTLKGKLMESSEGHRRHHERARIYRLERDKLIRRALKQGWTHAQIAQVTGLTRGRIGQFAQQLKEK